MKTNQDLKRLMPLMRTSDSKESPTIKKHKRGIIIELSGKSESGKTTVSNKILIPCFRMTDYKVLYFGEIRNRKKDLKYIQTVRYDYDFVIIETTED